ncbi:MAG: HAD family hydrolase [Phycisphaerales bacterium]
MGHLPPIEAVVFDFDGVIADSEGAHEAAMLATCREVGWSFTPEQYRRELIGYDDRDAYPAIARLNGATIEPSLAARLAESKRRLVEDMIDRGEVRPLPGSLELVRRAAARGPIAICSGALRSEIELMLDRFGVAEHFSVIVAADDVPRAKPDPAGYARAAEILGVPVGALVALEDTPTGVRAARAAVYRRVVGVCHSVPASELHEADLVVASTLELTLEQLFGDQVD